MLDTTKKPLNEELEEIYKIVLEKTTNLILVINENLQIEYCNEEPHKQLLGYSIEEIIGKSPTDFIHPKDINSTLKSLKKVFDGNEEKIELRLKCKNNSYKWFEIKGKRIEGKKSVLIAREVSKLTNYKQKLKEKESNRDFQDLCDSLTEISFWKLFQPKSSKAALEKSQEMLEFVINNIPEYIAWKDKNLTYLGGNVNFAKEVGVENSTELVGKTDFDILENETMILELNRKEKNVMDSDKPEYRTIETWLKSNKKKRMFETNRIPLHNTEGKVVGILITYEDITIRKMAEDALHESEKKYRHLFNSSPYAIWLSDLEGNIINCNSTTNHLLAAHKKEDIIGKNYKEVFAILGRTEQLIPLYEEQLEYITFKGKETKSIEFQLIRSDGKKLWLNVKSSIVELEEKSFFQTIIQDITEKKIAEQTIRESEEKYRTIFNASPDFIYLTDVEGNIIDANRELLEKGGYSREYVLGKNYLEFYSGENLDELLQSVNELKAGKEVKGIEVKTKSSRGEVLEFEVNAVPLKEDKKVTKILNIARDITDRKKAEQKLKESEQKYRHLFENSPYSIFLINFKGKIIDLNPATEKLFGRKKEDLINKYFTEIDIKPEIVLPLFKKRYDSIIKGTIPEPIDIQINRSIDGRLLWLRIDDSIVKIGDVTLFQILIQDITEKKIAEQNLRESEEKLKQLNKELEQKVLERTKELRESEIKLREQNIELKKLDEIKNDFITMAAHELKTPLISIAGYTDYILIKHHDNINSEIREDLLIVQRNIDRLQKLMNQLLDSLKIDENKLELEKEKVNVSNLIYTCVEDLTYQIKEKNHEIIVDVDNDIILNIDSIRISYVFANLLSNAIKFTENDGKIVISAKKEKDQVIFKCKDNGIGLTENELEYIFKKFSMIKQDTDIKTHGTGLGLYISKGIIEAHGGKIWVNSEGRNKGTTFTFNLPY